ncbi:CsbD family protein [Nocardiopsis sp. B62]|uniref:CsbD family protein n=1 Tax=Nocardiopsis sp. B62 TaxID=2824874 RepID=UPI001B361FF3|nr:CsbD family protein [Nocardiopsis sp. B62]MBQ1080021.1 CsbD family protein [Nocardiopsis sp. B62]
MGQSEKLRGRATHATGKVKELAGRATGNNRLRNRGRFEMFKGRALTRTEGWKDSVRGTLRSLRSKGR